jgi:hypothetical protein
MPSLVQGIGIVGAFIFGALIVGLQDSLVSAGVGLGSLLGRLLQLYFLLRIVPHASAIIDEYTRRKSGLPA